MGESSDGRHAQARRRPASPSARPSSSGSASTRPPASGRSPRFNQSLFSLKIGEVSDPIATARGEAILKPAEMKAAGPATFAEVKARVIADVVKKKQDEATLAAAAGGDDRRAPRSRPSRPRLGVKVETPEAFRKDGPDSGSRDRRRSSTPSSPAAAGRDEGAGLGRRPRGRGPPRRGEARPSTGPPSTSRRPRPRPAPAAEVRAASPGARLSGSAPERASRSTRRSSPASAGRRDRSVIGRLSGVVLEKRPDRAWSTSGVGYELTSRSGPTRRSPPSGSARASTSTRTSARTPSRSSASRRPRSGPSSRGSSRSRGSARSSR